MRILSLTPGTGGTFYCQNCLRDGQMVRSLRKRGHDIVVVPLYLPILLDSEGLNNEKVFFGGVNVYLQQRLGLFRNTPRWLDKLLDAPWMLRLAAKQEGSTRAADLGPMTYSMLQGRDGLQRKEFDRLLEWLKTEPKPDLVHVSNALLLGVAAEIRRVLGVPVVCSLQDEDTFIDAMTPAWRERVWKLMAEKARELDCFIAVSKWYAEKMRARLQLPPEKMRTVYLGVEWDFVEPIALDFQSPVLGFLSRIHPSQGFSDLMDAFIELKKDPRLKNLRLRATGGVTSGDKDYVREAMAHAERAGVAADVEIIEEFNRAARHEFLRTLTVLSAPAREGEAFGLFTVEANAHGVPVVQPDAGAFKEIVETTGGGVIYDLADKTGLVESLRRVLTDHDFARALGAKGHAHVHAHMTAAKMAENMEAVFQEFAR